MLVGAQNKVVKANQRAAGLQADVVRGAFVLRAFKMKVSFRLRSNLAAAAKRRVLSEWFMQCLISTIAKHDGHAKASPGLLHLLPVPQTSSSSSSTERERERERERRVYGESNARFVDRACAPRVGGRWGGKGR